MTALWRSWGVEPDAVIGHSQGEIAAAYVAGALSLEDSARIVALRSQAIAGLPAEGGGGMGFVPLPESQVAERIAAWSGRLHIAAVNGPFSTVVAGARDALEELVAACEADGLRASLIKVDYASHTPHMEPLREPVARSAGRSGTGDRPDASAVLDAGRRRAHRPAHGRGLLVREPVEPGAVRAGDQGPDRRRPHGLHRGQPARGPHRERAGDAGQPGRQGHGRRLGAPRRGRPGPVRRLVRARLRARRRSVLGRLVRRCDSGTGADLRRTPSSGGATGWTRPRPGRIWPAPGWRPPSTRWAAPW